MISSVSNRRLDGPVRNVTNTAARKPLEADSHDRIGDIESGSSQYSPRKSAAPARTQRRLPSLRSLLVGTCGAAVSAYVLLIAAAKGLNCETEQQLARSLDDKSFRPCGGPVVCDDTWAREFPLAEAYLNRSATYRSLVREIDQHGARIYLTHLKRYEDVFKAVGSKAVISVNPRNMHKFNDFPLREKACRTHPPSLTIAHEMIHFRNELRNPLATAYLNSVCDPVSTNVDEYATIEATNVIARELGLPARKSHVALVQTAKHVNDHNNGTCAPQWTVVTKSVRRRDVQQVIDSHPRGTYELEVLRALPFLSPRVIFKAAALRSRHKALVARFAAELSAKPPSAEAQREWQRHIGAILEMAKQHKTKYSIDRTCPISLLPKVER